MIALSRSLRVVTVAASGAAAALIGTSTAFAEPFDTQPTTLFCEGGIGSVESQTGATNESLDETQIFYYILEPNATGAQVAYLNISNGQVGFSDFVNAPEDAGIIRTLPIAASDTGPGTVVSAVFGLVRNAEGQTCLALPGLDVEQITEAPAEDD